MSRPRHLIIIVMFTLIFVLPFVSACGSAADLTEEEWAQLEQSWDEVASAEEGAIVEADLKPVADVDIETWDEED